MTLYNVLTTVLAFMAGMYVDSLRQVLGGFVEWLNPPKDAEIDYSDYDYR